MKIDYEAQFLINLILKDKIKKKNQKKQSIDEVNSVLLRELQLIPLSISLC
jgi:hypothetical protein